MSKSTCMLVKNTFTHDARVKRQALALLESGWEVSVICLEGSGLPRNENVDGINIFRVNRGPGSRARDIVDPSHNISSKENFIKRNLKHILISLVRATGRTWIRILIERGVDTRMYKVAMTLKPDVIHSHDLDTLELGVRLKQELGIPLVYDSHEMASARNLATPKNMRRARQLESKLIHLADAITMAAPGYAQRAVELYGIEYPEVLYNVPNKIAGSFEGFDLREKFSIPKKDFLLVHQGVLLPNRGVDQLIEAVGLLDEVQLVILGYGQHRAYLENLTAKLKLSGRVHFLGPLKPVELIKYSSSADVGVCTFIGTSDSYRHTMPNKLFEYAMAGLPIIASNYEGMGNFVKEHNCGIECDPESPKALAGAIDYLKNNPHMLFEFAKSSKEVSKTFNWESEKNKVINTYKKFR